MQHRHDILVIDHSELIHRSVAVLLRASHLAIRHASCGESGLRAVDDEPPSLILLDIDLGTGIDGLEVCYRLKSNPATREIPVIFLTSSATPEIKARAFEGGAADYIVKPFNTTELRARVGAALRTRELLDELAGANRSLEADLMRVEALQHRLEASEARFELAVKGSNDGLWDWDLETDSVYYAPRWKAILGLEACELTQSPQEWFGRIVSSDLHPFRAALATVLEGEEDHFTREFRILHEDGTVRWVQCRAAIVRDETARAVRMAGSLSDITETREAQQELADAKMHDKLTGLVNRDLFADRVQHAIQRSHRTPDYCFAVLFFDFDRFKVVNDSLGHDAGDALLVSIARRFESELREVDTAARFGGDEFVVLLDGLRSIDAACITCGRLIEAFNAPHEIDGQSIVSTASIGVVTSDARYERADEMIRDADAAMYQAKSAGKARYQLFDGKLREEVVRRLDLERHLRRANIEREFVVVYQPIVSLVTGVPAGFEALVRWQHPEQGLIRPDHFIPIAEETGMIVELGRHVLEVACRALEKWSSLWSGANPLTMNVNLSKRQIVDPGVVEMISAALAKYDILPSQLKLEITETTIVDDRTDLIPRLEEIRALGAPLAMDDFGTGQSSLSCLHRFPIDVLKIDRSFITNMEDNRDFAAVIHAVVTLAQHLGMTIVAEGLETVDQVALLQAQECDYGQGYYFAKPLSFADAEQYLLERNVLRRQAA